MRGFAFLSNIQISLLTEYYEDEYTKKNSFFNVSVTNYWFVSVLAPPVDKGGTSYCLTDLFLSNKCHPEDLRKSTGCGNKLL